MKIILSFLTVLVATSTFAEERITCAFNKQTETNIVPPSSTSPYSVVTIYGDHARTLYVEMTNVVPKKVDGANVDPNMLVKGGKDIACFMQPFDFPLNYCAAYQCNISFTDLSKGELQKF